MAAVGKPDTGVTELFFLEKNAPNKRCSALLFEICMQLLMHEDLHEYYHFKVLPISKNEKKHVYVI